MRSSSTVSWERISVSRWSQRRASAFSECFDEAVGVFIAETRKRAQRLMSARLVSPSRNLAQLGGGVDGHCPDGDDRGGSAFAGGVSGYFGVADHLYQPIRGLGNRG